MNGLGFREAMAGELARVLAEEGARVPEAEALRIDLHCHDRQSDVPDETIGRILRWPETWVSTEELTEVLLRHGTTALTITNHNNARSCFHLLDRGVDVIPGAEFTCHWPAAGVHVHVLTYGFDPRQEEELARLRENLPGFLEYARDQDLVTVLAHPLFFRAGRKVPKLDALERLTLLFDNFEGINGQRDSWQNLLAVSWFRSLDEEKIRGIAKRTGIHPERFCARPFRKTLIGGSDDHMALFAGLTGSLLHVPGLKTKRETAPASALALAALREGRAAPYGSFAGEHKMPAALLDYFCQIVTHADDPGLLRMLLHQGSVSEKVVAFLIANAAFELRRHRITRRFIGIARDALHGRALSFYRRLSMSREYRPMLRELEAIADVRRTAPERLEHQVRVSLPAVFHHLNAVLAGRVAAKQRAAVTGGMPSPWPRNPAEILERFEVPAELRALFGSNGTTTVRGGRASVDLRSLVDGLPFPALAAAVVAGASYTSGRVLSGARPLLNAVAGTIGRHHHPRRCLWLSDTFGDRNGVARSLALWLREIESGDLPIDLAIAHETAEPGPHLHVLKPLSVQMFPQYPDQPLRLFDLLEVQRIFLEGCYDRILCSTEGPMALAALYLKSCFQVKAHFYMHTDWLDFARRALGFDTSSLDRARRFLRALYRRFDGIFVLNSDHERWLASSAMGIRRERIRTTSHWVDPRIAPQMARKREVFDVPETTPVLLFAGRLSVEKGVMELPDVLQVVRALFPNARLAFAGEGPASIDLKAAVPDGVFLGWLSPERLSEAYSAADVFLFPSRFDTFGNVLVEALTCGLPVIAYDCKGPRDIVGDGECGVLVDDAAAMAAAAVRVLKQPLVRKRMSIGAFARAKDFGAEGIVDRFLRNLSLLEETPAVPKKYGDTILISNKTWSNS